MLRILLGVMVCGAMAWSGCDEGAQPDEATLGSSSMALSESVAVALEYDEVKEGYFLQCADQRGDANDFGQCVACCEQICNSDTPQDAQTCNRQCADAECGSPGNGGGGNCVCSDLSPQCCGDKGGNGGPPKLDIPKKDRPIKGGTYTEVLSVEKATSAE
ncbi:MAG: hypothetical protein ACI9MR_002719 [Myxococcota bacterium]|jgi:hypothetical protein